MNPINSHRVVRKLPNQSIYEVVNAVPIAKEVTQIFIRPSSESHLTYQAGQYLKVLHPDGNVSPLSIANAPSKKGLIELHLTHPEENLQAKDILRFVRNEKKLIVSGPFGNCTTKELVRDLPIIFLARGSGFAPIKAMIEEIKTLKQSPPIHFYWSATSVDEFYMDELLLQWTREIKHFSYTPVLSRPNPLFQGKTGWLQEVVLADYPDLSNSLVYISAPEPIVHDVLHVLQKAGLPRQQYFSDVFDYE